VILRTILACATFVATQGASAQASISVVVQGTTHTVSAASLQKLARDTARMVFHGQPALIYEGVTLAAVLREAGVRSDSLRGPALATRLVVEASDGYKVVLTLADLDPSLGGRRVLLADRVDGKTLPTDEAPWRLIVVGDQRPSRSARQVVRIRVMAESP
jgi:DMSO/TMAO reductase YedYZ molybdopterin-dependent catalytic subunit